MKPYNKSNIPLAKQLRKEMTPWERKLWYEYLRYYPLRFQRQKAIGNYIVDFYCAKARLVIELDGGGHYEPSREKADALRTRELKRMNLQVLRICNLDVDKNFRGVCEYIDASVQRSLPQSAALTAPSSEGALGYCIPDGTIYALGFFDGVHLGHAALLKACRQMADELGCKAGVVTFTTHPDALVKGQTPELINTPADRKLLLAGFSVDTVVELPFDRALMTMPWQAFFNLLLESYDAVGFVCGADFRFGNRGEGTAEMLESVCQENDVPCTVVPEQKLEGITVSSTHIRSLLEAGEVERANRFLGHPHILSGEVVSGRKLGRTLGIPTANLALPEELVKLPHGGYACKALVEGQEYLAVTNIGNRPTVGGHRVTVEPWLLDFDGDLYGKTITLEFHDFLRPEEKFESLEALKAEIEKNALQTRKFFEKK